MRARSVGLEILKPLRCRIGSTAPSVAGLRNLLECHAVASGPVSASPSPTTQATIKPGLSNTAPNEWLSESPNSPPLVDRAGRLGRRMAGYPPGKRKLNEKLPQ